MYRRDAFGLDVGTAHTGTTVQPARFSHRGNVMLAGTQGTTAAYLWVRADGPPKSVESAPQWCHNNRGAEAPVQSAWSPRCHAWTPVHARGPCRGHQ